MKAPSKMRVAQGGHIIEGDVTFTTGPAENGKAIYTMSLTGGYFVCGPHDSDGNHILEEE